MAKHRIFEQSDQAEKELILAGQSMWDFTPLNRSKCVGFGPAKSVKVCGTGQESRNLSMRRAGNLLGVSDSTVSHLENGRADLHPEIVMKLLHFYGYSYEQFISMSSGKIELPQSLRREYLEIIKRLDDEKLKTVRTILQSF